MPFLYLPKSPLGQVGNSFFQRDLNYEVDYHTGRIELSPWAAGEFADRFVVVHYFTVEFDGTKSKKVRHAEIMHVPTQIIWEYDFPTNIVIDGSPAVGNGYVYVPGQWKTTANKYQPALLTFAQHPEDPNNAQLLAQRNIGPAADNQVYRGMILPTPVS
ncbi:MAG TPA: hypothetical protein VHV83_11400, partial [Armatimonadota bacterium]|nr:hypothetical protein [Armatimonadota bacterium]